MAIKKEIWQKAQALFELGKSLSYISDETNINSSSISKKAKSEGWEKAKNQELKAEIIEADKLNSIAKGKNSIAIEKVSKLSDFEVTIMQDVVEDETGNKSLLFSTANLSLIRKNQMLTKNTKTIMTKEDYYEDGKKIMTKEIESEIPLSPNDYKVLDEGIDKNAVSIELAPRFSSSQVQVNNQNNNTQNNNDIIGYGVKVIDKN